MATGRRGHYFWPDTDPVAFEYDPSRAASRFTILPVPAEARARSEDVERNLARVYREAGIAWYVEWTALPSAQIFDADGAAPSRLVRAALHHPRPQLRDLPRADSGRGRPALALEAQLDLRAHGIDVHARRGREPERTAVAAAARAHVEAVAVPRTAHAARHDGRVREGTEPVRALRRVREELPLDLDHAIAAAAEVDRERQARAQRGERPERRAERALRARCGPARRARASRRVIID